MISVKNYFKDTSVKVKKFGLWLKGIIGAAAGSTYIQGDAKLALYFLVGGAIIAGILECLPPDGPSAPQPQTNSAAPGVVAGLIALIMLFCITGCSVIKPQVDRTKSDTTLTSYKQVDLKIKGAKVFAGLNMDSLYHAALMAKDQRSQDSILSLKQELNYKADSIAALKANKPIPPKTIYVPSAPQKQYVTDPQTRAQLAYWIDAYGKFQITCESKDQTITTLQAQVTKLTKDTTVTTKVAYQTPAWNKIAMIVEGIAIAVLALILIFKLLL